MMNMLPDSFDLLTMTNQPHMVRETQVSNPPFLTGLRAAWDILCNKYFLGPERIQLVKSLLSEHKGLSSIPRTQIKVAQYGDTHSVATAWHQRQGPPWVQRRASLAYLESSRPAKDPVSKSGSGKKKKKSRSGWGLKNNTKGCHLVI